MSHYSIIGTCYPVCSDILAVFLKTDLKKIDQIYNVKILKKEKIAYAALYSLS